MRDEPGRPLPAEIDRNSARAKERAGIRLPAYFRPARWERGGDFYLKLGVRRFRPYVAGGTFWKKRFPGLKAEWGAANYLGYVRQSVIAEIAHSVSLGLMLMFSALMAADRAYISAGVFLALNILLNLIPITVLRYNRARMLRNR